MESLDFVQTKEKTNVRLVKLLPRVMPKNLGILGLNSTKVMPEGYIQDVLVILQKQGWPEKEEKCNFYFVLAY